MEKTYSVSIDGFDGIQADNPLKAAKEISSWLEDGVIFTVTDEQTNESFTVDLSEDDEDAVLPLTEVKTINAYQLHDSETEEILGTVFIEKAGENASDEIFDGWETFNKLDEHELDNQDVNEFVEWFNKNYVTKLGIINMDFIQP